MKKMILALALITATFAQDRKTVYVDRMDGLEASVEKALRDAELPFEFIEERNQPDLKVKIDKMHTGAYAEILYKKNTGRLEDHRLEMIDVKTGKTIANYSFKFDSSEDAKARIASGFAAQVKSKMKSITAR